MGGRDNRRDPIRRHTAFAAASYDDTENIVARLEHFRIDSRPLEVEAIIIDGTPMFASTRKLGRGWRRPF